jgi:hypothetical protein
MYYDVTSEKKLDNNCASTKQLFPKLRTPCFSARKYLRFEGPRYNENDSAKESFLNPFCKSSRTEINSTRENISELNIDKV